MWKLRIIVCGRVARGWSRSVHKLRRAIRPDNKVMIDPVSEMHRSSELLTALALPVSPARGGAGSTLTQDRAGRVAADHRGALPGRVSFAGFCTRMGIEGLTGSGTRLESGERWDEYPRYLFVNESTDILFLCGADAGPARGGVAVLEAETRSRWRSGTRWGGWTSSSGQSTDAHALPGDGGSGARALRAGRVRSRGRADRRGPADARSGIGVPADGAPPA